MGYRKKPKVYNLVFGEDNEFAGLQIQATGMPVGDMLEIVELHEKADGNDVTATVDLLQRFASHLKGWNLEEEDGTPVPVTFEALMQQEIGFVLAIIEYWVQSISSVALDLGKDSNSGATSEEGRLPMEALS